MPAEIPIIGQKGIEEKETITLYLQDKVLYNTKVYRMGLCGKQLPASNPDRVVFSCDKIVFEWINPSKAL